MCLVSDQEGMGYCQQLEAGVGLGDWGEPDHQHRFLPSALAAAEERADYHQDRRC
jgi:hypothetical protein